MPNVIDARAFAHGAGDAGVTRAQLGLEPAGQVVVLVGRLTRQKGPDILIDAAEMVLARRTGVTFVVAGDGPLRAELEAAVRQRALGRSVRFLGYRKDVASLFAASDIVAMPSRSEGHPVALLEALALARPVVATRVGGIEDIIVHGESGWLVPPEHPECLADALVALLDDAEMARRLGDAGRRVVQRDCAPERAARRLATVYRTVLAEREA
jgi:glycosyltransferase involved in cell wall biosynthesis